MVSGKRLATASSSTISRSAPLGWPSFGIRPRRSQSRHGIPERGETGEIEGGRLNLTQVQQEDQRRIPLSATSLSCLGERARVAPRGSWLTGDHVNLQDLTQTTHLASFR